MALQARLVASGLSAQNAAAIQGTVGNTLTATGTTQGTALALPGDVNRFTTVGANSGTILPAMNPGDAAIIFNGGANALSVYPPTGGQINAVGANTAYSVATATPLCLVFCVTPLVYLALQSA
jgi:hypothetical protein